MSKKEKNEKVEKEETKNPKQENGEKPDNSEKKANKAEKENPLQKELDEVNDRLLRLTAEYSNFKRRSEKEKQDAYAFAKADTVKELLPMIDNFERALANESEDYEALKKNIKYASDHPKEIAVMTSNCINAANNKFNRPMQIAKLNKFLLDNLNN